MFPDSEKLTSYNWLSSNLIFDLAFFLSVNISIVILKYVFRNLKHLWLPDIFAQQLSTISIKNIEICDNDIDWNILNRTVSGSDISTIQELIWKQNTCANLENTGSGVMVMWSQCDQQCFRTVDNKTISVKCLYFISTEFVQLTKVMT